MMLGLGSLILLGFAVATLIFWLTSRRFALPRVIGWMIAAAVIVCCGVVVFALIAGGIGEPPRFAGVLSTTAFAVCGVSALVAAIRGALFLSSSAKQ